MASSLLSQLLSVLSVKANSSISAGGKYCNLNFVHFRIHSSILINLISSLLLFFRLYLKFNYYLFYSYFRSQVDFYHFANPKIDRLIINQLTCRSAVLLGCRERREDSDIDEGQLEQCRVQRCTVHHN